jgi:hypothetical protein
MKAEKSELLQRLDATISLTGDEHTTNPDSLPQTNMPVSF